jgi:2EXR family
MSLSKTLHSKTFHLFPLLPKELQLRIWELANAAIGHRVIELRGKFTRYTRPEGTNITGRELYEWKYAPPCPVPVILHICHTSRSLSLHRWQLLFASTEQVAKVFFRLRERYLVAL